jgi:hypothetical protein
MTVRSTCCLLLLAAASNPVAMSADEKPANWAEKMFSHLEHDFGVVTKGAEAKHRIEIKNVFGEPITLHAAKSTCGCTTPALSTKLLQPGEVGYLELTLNTTRFSKQKHPNVDVQLSFGKSGLTTVRIPVHAYIRDDVTTSEDTVDFGIVGTGEAATKSMTVSYHGYNQWKITGVRDSGKGVAVEISKPTRTPQGLTYELKLTLSPELPMGAYERSLIVLTEEPTHSYIPLRVKATIEPDIVVATPVVNLGVVKAGVPMKKTLVIRGRKPFAVEAVEGAPGLVTADLQAAASKSVQVVPLTITAPVVAGKFSQELLVKIANHAPVTCRVEGEVLATELVEAAR